MQPPPSPLSPIHSLVAIHIPVSFNSCPFHVRRILYLALRVLILFDVCGCLPISLMLMVLLSNIRLIWLSMADLNRWVWIVMRLFHRGETDNDSYVLTLALSNKWDIRQLDIKNPPGFMDTRFLNHVCHLKRSLYGLKEAPRTWYTHFAAFVTSIGFKHSQSDNSLFV
ncbi:hypothetical protein OSB04_003565 [Centaurea solstitialis]|uniref:Reverse transcriptase Ty1/copia-type domain-containing protein n=1 Tax=Centaurea solstitialis TaxID=347529 RepID=A0AA38TVD5_9ASTR|nr:hypothetical protein OSB04_003565 [Centaurea solstitialis]